MSALIAYFHPKEPQHQSVSALFEHSDEPLVVSPYVVAELDCMILSRFGVRAELAVLREILSPAWEIVEVIREQIGTALGLIEQYETERIGLTDAVNMAVAAAYHTRRIATLDHRHFGSLRFPDGSPVEILP